MRETNRDGRRTAPVWTGSTHRHTRRTSNNSMNSNFLSLIGSKQIKSIAGQSGVKRTHSSHHDRSDKRDDQAKKPKLQSDSKPTPVPTPALKPAPPAASQSTPRGYPELHPFAKSGPPTAVLALDCEMVGIGPGGERSALARVSIVNSRGEVVLDKFVKPAERVTDYRTHVSGVEPKHLVGAMGFAEAQKAIAALIDDRVLVGHGLTHDFEVMMLSHPRKLTRDTAHYKPLCPYRPRALRDLASEQLGVTNLHAGAHDSVQDARCALAIYHKHKVEWEQSLRGVGKAPAAAVPTKADRAQAKKQAKVDARAAAQAALSAENEFDKLLKHI